MLSFLNSNCFLWRPLLQGPDGSRWGRWLLAGGLLLGTWPASGQAVRIMPVGNSITQGAVNHNSYRRALWQKLQAGNYAVDFVGSQNSSFNGPSPNPDFDLDHEGHWGYRADQLLASIQGWAQSARPDIVLLHAGSNDMLQNQSPASTRDEVGQMIDQLRTVNPAVKVLLAQLIPNLQTGVNANLMAYNALLPALAAQKTTAQSPVVLVDQFTGFSAATDNYDGTHPNAAGEEKMATVWYRALRSLLGTPLPVILTDFTVQSETGGARLRWHTASESRNTGFQLERSRDGQLFTPLGFVAAAGTARGGASYSYWDAPLPAEARLYYYRLQQRDEDGQVHYSGVVALHTKPLDGLFLYPIPATDWLGWAGLLPDERIVEAVDVQGRRWAVPPLPPATQQADIRALPPGLYLLRTSKRTGRFLKQH